VDLYVRCTVSSTPMGGGKVMVTTKGFKADVDAKALLSGTSLNVLCPHCNTPLAITPHPPGVMTQSRAEQLAQDRQGLVRMSLIAAPLLAVSVIMSVTGLVPPCAAVVWLVALTMVGAWAYGLYSFLVNKHTLRVEVLGLDGQKTGHVAFAGKARRDLSFK
jgi:hypothetical protein